AALPSYTAGTNNISVSSGGTLAISVGGAGEFATSDIDALLSTANASFNAGATLGVNVNTGNSVTYGSLIGNSSGGSMGLAKLGAGTLKLTNAGNTYKGGTVVAGGVLTIDSDTSTGGNVASELGTVPTSNASGNAGLTLSGGTLHADASFNLNGN